MNPLRSPRLECLTNTPTGPQDAEQTSPHTALGDPKGVAEGVPTAVRPDPQQGDGRYPVAWLHITVPHGATPTAASRCECGWSHRAFGRARVLALIDNHTDHREHCPLRTAREGRDAA
ncbi:hypothetical protein [Streptomyces sp. NBC_00038]|uniref:hypothetical protein n=1 Tax=Streptomyces sp. NBC_00038 TaxID=2903615 RepID=UPI0022501BF6|nr:hypothetical protein [Streptomyces sp. NBC_00038]MCX5559936.1 hypothetical protein [Streptomyces sp. NBC_00038]